MSNLDPNRDFRDPNELPSPRYDMERGAGTTWGWIIGGAAAIVLVLVALTFTRDNTDTASNVPPAPPAATQQVNPPSTTGQAPADETRPATPPAQAPAQQ